MPDLDTAVRAEHIIRETVQRLLVARGVAGLEVRADSKLIADLGLDSLELAELSAVLEDEIGYDPFSEGILPDTLGELVGYYER